MNTPHEISPKELKEIMAVPIIRDAWGFDEDVTMEEFCSVVYGVRFDFASLSPGYVGDLYLLCGDAIGEPFTLIRTKKGLRVVPAK